MEKGGLMRFFLPLSCLTLLRSIQQLLLTSIGADQDLASHRASQSGLAPVIQLLIWLSSAVGSYHMPVHFRTGGWDWVCMQKGEMTG